MRLRTLRLRNYRRFRDTVLEFPDGLIAVTGANGAGKSTLIEAIMWALFGHDAARTQKEFLKRSAAAPGEDVEVRLEFELDGVAYAVSRRLRGRSQQSEAQVEADGSLVVAPGANSSELASRKVARILGMERRGFQATVVANQGDLSALSDTNPGERKRLILGLLGVDEIDQAIAFARTEKREAAIRLEEVRRGLARETELRGRLEQATRESGATNEKVAHARTEATQEEAALRACDEAESALGKAREAHRDLRGRLENLQRSIQIRQEQTTRIGSEIQLLDQRQQELARTQARLAEFADLDERLAVLEAHRASRALREPLEAERNANLRELERWKQAEAPHAIVDATGEALEAEIRELRGRVERDAARLAEVEAHAQHVDADRRRLQTDAAHEADAWRELHALGPHAPCPLCHRVLGEAIQTLVEKATADEAQRRARLAALAEERENLRVQAEALRRGQDAERSTLAEREKLLETLRLRHEQSRLARKERERLAKRLADVEARLAALGPAPPEPADHAVLERRRAERERGLQALARLEAEVSRAPKLRVELAALHAEAQSTRNEIEAATREVGALAYKEGSWEEAHRASEAVRARLHAAQRRCDVLAERAASLQAQVEQIRTDVGTLQATRQEAAELEARVRLGELLAADRGDQGVLPEFKRHLIGRIRPALARAAGELALEMTQGRYQELSIDEDYTIRVYEGGTAWPLERFSGGEVDVVNLAVRLAVSELLAHARRASRIQFVALDEVLAGQDEARRRSVLGALKRLGTHFRQVLLVTHLDEVRERVDHVIRVQPQTDGTSAIVTSWSESGLTDAAPEQVAETIETLTPSLEP